MPSWPVGLPQTPEFGSFSEQKQRNATSFTPEVGPPKMRKRATASGSQVTAKFRMTDAQVVTFNDFFENTLDDGTIAFDWAHPVNGNTYSWMFAVDAAPTREIQGHGYNFVTCKLVRLP